MTLPIVHLAKFYPPDRGGMEEACQILASGVAAAGARVEVDCFLSGASGTDGTAEPGGDAGADGVVVRRHRVWRTVSSQPFSLAYLRAAWQALRQRVVVHLHAPNLLAALAVALVPRRHARLIVHWHSDIVAKGLLGQLVKPLEWMMLARADAVVATSEPYAAASPMLRRFRAKLHVIPLGARAPVVADSQVAKEPGLVLAVGRLVPYKGFSTLIDAAPLLAASARVVIAGGGPLEPALRAQVQAAGVADRVQVLGRVSEHELARLYGAADLFCLPSLERSEAFGMVLLEAMAAGLPIVACRIPGSGVPWVNQHGITGLNVEVADARALAEACNELLREPQTRQRMSERARARFAELFTAEATTRRWLALYRAVQDEGRPPAEPTR